MYGKNLKLQYGILSNHHLLSFDTLVLLTFERLLIALCK